jgi:hypothetical protein
MTYQRGDKVTHPDLCGAVLHVVGPELEDRVIEPDWDTLVDDNGNPMDADVWWPEPEDIETVETGRLLVRMVGDDRDHAVDPDDLTPYDGPVCSCGQVGCGWH